MKVALFGGTGFVGNYIVKELFNQNYVPRVLVREGSENKLSKKCELVLGSIDNKEAIMETMSGVEAIIYNIGIIREFPFREVTFENLHYKGLLNCIKIASDSKINRFILMSANGVKKIGTAYQTTKWRAECILKESNLDWTIFRPSLIFGNPEGYNRPEFCTELKNNMLSLPIPAPLFYSGLLPLNAGSFCMSPIHVSNVAEFFVKSINNSKFINNTYDLGGTKILTWKEIIHKIAKASNKLTWKVPAPAFGIKLIASIFDRFEWFPVTKDQITMLLESNVVDKNYFNEFDIKEIPFTENNLSYLKNN